MRGTRVSAFRDGHRVLRFVPNMGPGFMGIGQMVFTPNGRHLVTGSVDRKARLWDVADPAVPVLVAAVTHRGRVHAVTCSPDGELLAAGGSDRRTTLWGIAAPEAPIQLAALDNQRMTVDAVAFAPDGRFLATTSGYRSRFSAVGDRAVTIWAVDDAAAPSRVSVLPAHQQPVLAAAFSPDGSMLATGCTDRTVRLWDVRDVTSPRRLACADCESMIGSVSFSVDGSLLYAAGFEGVTLWDLGADVTAPVRLSTLPHRREVLAMAVTADGRLVASTDGSKILLWDVSDPAVPQKPEELSRSRAEVWSLAFSPDGRLLAGGDSNGTTTLYHVGNS
ncbi:WD-40 repeat protein [Parafrankia sp. EUN1f]|nr:WD-40 repeat protein [Parafrankia sp. EUN1f]